MFQDISNWYNNRFATKDAAVFLIILVAGVLIINFFGEMLAPILASIVIAFLLESVVSLLCQYTKMSRIFSVIIVYLAFLRSDCYYSCADSIIGASVWRVSENGPRSHCFFETFFCRISGEISECH